MTDEDIQLLRGRKGLRAVFHCNDGEIIVGTVHFVSDQERDVIYDLISSNRQSRYQGFGNCAFRLGFDEIDFVTIPES